MFIITTKTNIIHLHRNESAIKYVTDKYIVTCAR